MSLADGIACEKENGFGFSRGRITELETLSYFENQDFKTRHGVYKCKFKGDVKIFVISNNLVYVLSHYTDKSTLDKVVDSVACELFELLGLERT